MTTRSPLRTSRRRISSRLCSVARLTVVPPTSTGASAATGVGGPIRPTDTRMSSARAVPPRRQLARRRGLRFKLPHGAGGRVARIREERLAALGALLVRRVERGGRQVHLAADVEASLQRLAERERYGAERAQVRGHVLAGEAVAPRRALHEPAVLVREVDREP